MDLALEPRRNTRGGIPDRNAPGNEPNGHAEAEHTSVRVYTYEDSGAGGGCTWHDTIVELKELCSTPTSNKKCTIAFLDTDTILSSRQGSQEQLSLAFSIPESFWEDLCQHASGYFSGVQRSKTTTSGSSGEEEAHITSFRFLIKHPTQQRSYRWEKLSFVTHWRPPGLATLLCFDVSAEMQSQMREALFHKDVAISTSFPYSLHAFVLEYVVRSFDRSVWSWRDHVRALEKSRPTVQRMDHDYASMHDLARHTIQCSEVLRTTMSVLDSMLEDARIYGQSDESKEVLATKRNFEFYQSMLKCLHNRSEALERRLSNEINLVFNINAQRDSYTASRIAEATHRDGQVMKGISFLGMLFLPATFISALFGMSFFHFTDGSDGEPEQWTVSREFWIYWALALPVTGATVGFWLMWQRSIGRHTAASTYWI